MKNTIKTLILILIICFCTNKIVFAANVSGSVFNGASGKVEILNNSKNDSSGDFSLNISLDFDPDSNDNTRFKLPQASDDQIVIKLLGSTGKTLVSSKISGVANLKPTSNPIFAAIYPKDEFLKAFPDPSAPENNAFVQIEDFTSKKIYYKSNTFRVFQYTKQISGDSGSKTGNGGGSSTDTTKYYFTWQENPTGFKFEREIIGKTACEKERTSGEYKITTPCSTTSQEAQNTVFNSSLSTSGLKFTWKMENFITKEVRSGGGNTANECEVNRAGKILDLDQNTLKNWKYTKACNDLSSAENPYYFNWQDKNTLMKSEVSFVNKTDCEKERVNTKYTNATDCYTPSKQSEINQQNSARPVDSIKNTEFKGEYKLLAPLPGLKTVDTVKDNMGTYLNKILLIAIGLCGALAVIMIVIYGVQYMGDESVFGKTEAKSNIKHAIIGVILALGAYLILNAINPKLTGGTVTMDKVKVVLEGDVNAPVSVNKKNVSSVGFICNGGGKPQIPTIAKSFKGKMTYSQDIPKGQVGPKNTIKLDCSGFVNYVLSCAGVDNSKINSGTSVIFSNAEKVNSITNTQVNGKDLQLGDLVGWRPQDNSSGNGHVLIYIGSGQVADSHGGSGRVPGNAFGVYPTTHYKDKIKFVKRM